mgnify:FL=1
MMNLTHDEMNLLCIYQTNTRRETINAIMYMQQYLEPDETELAEMSDSLLAKLEQMSDEEFDEMEKVPDFR